MVLHCTTPKSGFHQPGHESLSTTSTTFRELDAAVVVVDIDQVSVVSCFHHPDTRDLVSCFISTTTTVLQIHKFQIIFLYSFGWDDFQFHWQTFEIVLCNNMHSYVSTTCTGYAVSLYSNPDNRWYYYFIVSAIIVFILCFCSSVLVLESPSCFVLNYFTLTYTAINRQQLPAKFKYREIKIRMWIEF